MHSMLDRKFGMFLQEESGETGSGEEAWGCGLHGCDTSL
jgi:hypothetical protein